MAHRTRTKQEVAAWGAAAFAALLASQFAFRSVRDALVLDGNPEQIPWLFLATFVAISVASPAWSALLAKWSRRRSIPLAFHASAACLVGFFLILRAELAPVAVGRVFYVWSAVFNLFVVSVFWSLLADLLGPGTARQLYGPIAAGGTVGTLVGPLLTRVLVGTIGVAGVLMVSAVLLELAMIAIYCLRRAARELGRDAGPAPAEPPAERPAERPAEPPAEPPDVPLGGGAFTGIAHVAKSRYLSALVGYVLCTACAATFMYLAQAKMVHDAFPDREARTSYFASLDWWTSAATLVVQTALAAPAIGRFGPGIVLAVLPLAQLAGISVLAVAPSLTVLAIAQVISRSVTHGLTRPARELLFTVVSRDDKYRAKHAIDTIGYRLGDLASSWLYKGLVAISAGGGALVGATIPLVGLWLGCAFVLGAGFRRRAGKEPSPP